MKTKAYALCALLILGGCTPPRPPEMSDVLAGNPNNFAPNTPVSCWASNDAVETASACDADLRSLQADSYAATHTPEYLAQQAATDACIRKLVASGFYQTAAGEMYMMCSGNGYVSPLLWRDQEESDSSDDAP